MEANAARRKMEKAKSATEHSTPAKDAAAKAAKEVSKQQQVHQDDDDVAARRAAHRAKAEAMQKAFEEQKRNDGRVAMTVHGRGGAGGGR